MLIQKVYTHFKKTPGTHKLGVLYVVDSVTRQWLDQARKAGQSLGPAAADGSFAAGVNHVTELLPSFMTDILNACPDEQKVCSLESLLDRIAALEYYIRVRRMCTSVPLYTLCNPQKEFTVCMHRIGSSNSRILAS